MSEKMEDLLCGRLYSMVGVKVDGVRLWWLWWWCGSSVWRGSKSLCRTGRIFGGTWHFMLNWFVVLLLAVLMINRRVT